MVPSTVRWTRRVAPHLPGVNLGDEVIANLATVTQAELGPQDPEQPRLRRPPTRPGHTIAEIVTKTGITRTSLYRHLAPRPTGSLTADSETATSTDER